MVHSPLVVAEHSPDIPTDCRICHAAPPEPEVDREEADLRRALELSRREARELRRRVREEELEAARAEAHRDVLRRAAERDRRAREREEARARRAALHGPPQRPMRTCEHSPDIPTDCRLCPPDPEYVAAVRAYEAGRTERRQHSIAAVQRRMERREQMRREREAAELEASRAERERVERRRAAAERSRLRRQRLRMTDAERAREARMRTCVHSPLVPTDCRLCGDNDDFVGLDELTAPSAPPAPLLRRSSSSGSETRRAAEASARTRAARVSCADELPPPATAAAGAGGSSGAALCAELESAPTALAAIDVLWRLQQHVRAFGSHSEADLKSRVIVAGRQCRSNIGSEWTSAVAAEFGKVVVAIS